MASAARIVQFAGTPIPILAPEHLIICKAIFNRPKDWVDIEGIVDWGTSVNWETVRRWIEDLLGAGSAQHKYVLNVVPCSGP